MDEYQNKQLDLSEFEVVRQDYGSGQEPQLTLSRERLYLNNYAIKMFPDYDYMQILVDKKRKWVVIKPLKTKIKDSFKWCTSGKKRVARKMKCVPVYYLMYEMMGWDLNVRYRITGEIDTTGETPILVFRLIDAIGFVKELELDEYGRPIVKECLPRQWEHTFGIPQMEYANREDVKVFDDTVVFDLQLDVNNDASDTMQRMRNGKQEREVNHEDE